MRHDVLVPLNSLMFDKIRLESLRWARTFIELADFEKYTGSGGLKSLALLSWLNFSRVGLTRNWVGYNTLIPWSLLFVGQDGL